MDAVAYSNFRKNLKSYMKQVNDDSETLLITARQSEDAIVVMGKRDYDAIQETLHLLSSPKTMNNIRRGLQQFEEGKGTLHELLQEKTFDD